ncbi:hypothetical protein BaRGS_00019973 [Batillaria attramentaria]|uniref:Uncharacterized protein n=1 Tax=Batillaria attramentaria TaxID=370345 RepID=A0ABD0KP28_9CAEN
MAGKKGKRRQDHLANDLTVYDYADSARPAGTTRIKKGAANSVIREVKKLSGGESSGLKMKEDEDDTNWFDKDLDDFDIPLTKDCNLEDEEDTAESSQEGATARSRRKGASKTASAETKTGIVYPVDLWFTLAEYVHADAVGRFARLCKDAYSATKKAWFWRKLYTRYYTKDSELPEDLKPQAMERTHGLRARCIRAMFVTCPTLNARIRPPGPRQPLEADPYSLIGHRCILSWHQPRQGRWLFCFKLKKPSKELASTTRPLRQESLEHGYNNLWYNPEEGCCVLQVTSNHFHSTSPQVMGQLLTEVHMSLSQGFLHQRLRLSFDTTRVCGPSSAAAHVAECVLDPVLAVRIIHWWDPDYPFPT